MKARGRTRWVDELEGDIGKLKWTTERNQPRSGENGGILCSRPKFTQSNRAKWCWWLWSGRRLICCTVSVARTDWKKYIFYCRHHEIWKPAKVLLAAEAISNHFFQEAIFNILRMKESVESNRKLLGCLIRQHLRGCQKRMQMTRFTALSILKNCSHKKALRVYQVHQTPPINGPQY